MQTLDNAMEFVLSRRWCWPFRKVLRSRNLSGKPIPTYIEGANKTATALARRIDGTPQNAVTEVLLGIPITAHVLGGCIMGRDADSGVVDKEGKVFGQDEMYVVDGSIVSANLGVNPSLTIAALAEHCMSKIPDRAERPADWP
jgi:cholesterol oxidase